MIVLSSHGLAHGHKNYRNRAHWRRMQPPSSKLDSAQLEVGRSIWSRRASSLRLWLVLSEMLIPWRSGGCVAYLMERPSTHRQNQEWQIPVSRIPVAMPNSNSIRIYLGRPLSTYLASYRQQPSLRDFWPSTTNTSATAALHTILSTEHWLNYSVSVLLAFINN